MYFKRCTIKHSFLMSVMNKYIHKAVQLYLHKVNDATGIYITATGMMVLRLVNTAKCANLAILILFSLVEKG